jgi:hypothetical protein
MSATEYVTGRKGDKITMVKPDIDSTPEHRHDARALGGQILLHLKSINVTITDLFVIVNFRKLVMILYMHLHFDLERQPLEMKQFLLYLYNIVFSG